MFSKIIIYARFSSAGQSEGTSLERQFGDIEAWIAREGLADLPTLHVTDEGRSGYHGHHRSLGDFGRLEKEIAAGEHVGSLFVCEDLDRLSRQGFDIGNDMIRSFISHGVSVRSLKGDVYDAGTKTALDQNIRALVRLEMAHEESAKKAERTAANWRLRREKCRTEGTLVSKNCPPWIEADAQNKPRAIRDRAELVRRFFEMADQGLGADAISRTMAAEGIEPWTRYKGREAAVWTRGTIIRILQNRETIGEYQPRKDGRPDGEPWIGHYPAIVSHDLFERVSAAASARKKMAGGRRSPRIGNLFATSIKCACCGQSMTYQIGRSEGSTFDNRGKSYSYKRDCASLVCRTAQISKGTKCKNVAHWAYLTLEDTLVSILLPLAFDDSAFSNRGEVARISQLIAERKRTLELVRERSVKLWNAYAATTSDGAMNAALAADEEASTIEQNLEGLDRQLSEAGGRTAAAEHLKRIEDIRDNLYHVDMEKRVALRRKVAIAMVQLIDRIEVDDVKAIVRLAGASGTININRKGTATKRLKTGAPLPKIKIVEDILAERKAAA